MERPDSDKTRRVLHRDSSLWLEHRISRTQEQTRTSPTVNPFQRHTLRPSSRPPRLHHHPNRTPHHPPRKLEAVRENGHAKRTVVRPKPSGDGTRTRTRSTAFRCRLVRRERTSLLPRNQRRQVSQRRRRRVSGVRTSISTRTMDTMFPVRRGPCPRGMCSSIGWLSRGTGIGGLDGLGSRGRRRVVR